MQIPQFKIGLQADKKNVQHKFLIRFDVKASHPTAGSCDAGSTWNRSKWRIPGADVFIKFQIKANTHTHTWASKKAAFSFIIFFFRQNRKTKKKWNFSKIWQPNAPDLGIYWLKLQLIKWTSILSIENWVSSFFIYFSNAGEKIRIPSTACWKVRQNFDSNGNQFQQKKGEKKALISKTEMVMANTAVLRARATHTQRIRAKHQEHLPQANTGSMWNWFFSPWKTN